MENNPNVPNHQPDWAVQSLRLIFMNQQTGLLNTATSCWDPRGPTGSKLMLQASQTPSKRERKNAATVGCLLFVKSQCDVPSGKLT